MKTAIINIPAVGRLAILTMATFLLLAMPGHAEDEAAKKSIREVQQALNECGFNAGPSDGIYGNRTTRASTAFVRAHGGTPDTGNKTLLLAQVDFYRAGDAGPCPPEGTEAEATTQASDESEPAGEAGSVTAEAGSVETDQAEEVEIIKEDPYKEITELLDGKEYKDGYPSVEFQIIEEDKSLLIREQEYCNIGGCVWYFPLSELEARYSDYDNDEGEKWYSVFGVQCRNDKICGYRSGTDSTDDLGDPYYSDSDLYEALAAGRESVKNIIWGERRRTGYAFSHYHRETEQYGLQPMFTREEEKRIVAAFDRLHENVNQSTGNTTGQPVKCYNWVTLGTFHLGKWRNGNGRETSGLPAGLSTKIWDDEKLFKDYETVREHCVTSANDAMDSAISAMVLIGRQASDVDNEKKRIRSFYKASLDKCQATFKKRFKKYENKFCE